MKMNINYTHWTETKHRISSENVEQDEQELSIEEIKRLPCLASKYYSNEVKAFGLFGWSPPLRALLNGVHDCNSPLSLFRGHEGTLIRNIYAHLPSNAEHVTLTIPATNIGRHASDRMVRFYGKAARTYRNNADHEHSWPGFREGYAPIPPKSTAPSDFVAWTTCGKIQFPTPKNRNVNMMPFIFGDISTLPLELRCYEECIKACPVSSSDVGKVFYLTVHESYVDPASAQRREGLHIEAPGTILEEGAPAFSPGSEHEWGRGMFFEPDHYEGGIYMASSVSNTSRLYDAIVDNNSVSGIVDAHGGCEYLRPLFGHKGTNLKEGQLIWMTDRTPHEALPQESAGVRQFFRLVTSEVSHWFAKHSTPNPNVHLPGHVVVIYGDKFEDVK